MIVLEWQKAARTAAWTLAAILALVLGAARAEAGSTSNVWFTDSAGRRVEVQAEIRRVLAAGPPAAVLLYSLAPDKLIGWPHALDAQTAAILPRQYASLPVVGRLTGHSGAPSPQAIMALHPDIIVDIGDVEPEYVALADRIQHQTRVPYVLLDGRLSNTAQTYRLLGELLGEKAQAETLATYAEQTLSRLHEKLAGRGLRVYYARGADGLTTGAKASLTGEFIGFAGVVNVANGEESVMKTSLEQIQIWHPDTILAHDPAAYKQITTDARWAEFAPVKNGRVYLSPQAPFGWIDEPPATNRLLGIQWLAATLYPDAGIGEIRAITMDFCSRFYHVKLSETQLTAILAAAQ